MNDFWYGYYLGGMSLILGILFWVAVWVVYSLLRIKLVNWKYADGRVWLGYQQTFRHWMGSWFPFNTRFGFGLPWWIRGPVWNWCFNHNNPEKFDWRKAKREERERAARVKRNRAFFDF